MRYFLKNQGYSIIELLVVIVIIGIITAVALKSLRTVNDTVRTERTKKELDQLAYAVAGDPNMASGGARTDFGYVGDVGGMPTNLDALVSNPGGYATWQGPYLRDDYLPSSGSSNTEFKVDEWGTAYSYSGGSTITSTGGGSSITRQVANSVNDLLYNSVAVTVTDINHSPPGDEKDSVLVALTFPNGAGGTTTKTKNPARDGYTSVDSVPIGQHTLYVIYTPDADTMTRRVIVNPGQLTSVNVGFNSSLWGTSSSGAVPYDTVTIRPNGSGAATNLTSGGCPSQWQCVDEVSSDNDATYVTSSGATWKTDTYAAEDPAVTGLIDSIFVYMRVRNTGPGQKARTTIRVGSTNYDGADRNLDGVSSYTVYSTKYILNPGTAATWTWADINSVQIGVSLQGTPRCTQVWADVYYRI